MGKCAKRINSDELYEQIQALSPEPFRDLLTRVLNAEPSQEALQAFVDKHPDRWDGVSSWRSSLSRRDTAIRIVLALK